MVMPYAQLITSFLGFDGWEERKAAARRCQRLVGARLRPRPERVYVADDGSPPGRLAAFATEMREDAVVLCRPEASPGGVGASLNRGFKQAREDGYRILLYAVDDWYPAASWRGPVLEGPLRLMEADPSVLSVRLGPPHPWLSGDVIHTTYGWYLDIDPHHYALAQRPALWRTGTDGSPGGFNPGDWPEGVSAIDCEREMNERWCARRKAHPHTDRILYWLPPVWEPHPGSVSLSERRPS